MGESASVEKAARQSIDDRIAEQGNGVGGALEQRAWAKPMVNEGIAALEWGDFLALDAHGARNASLCSARAPGRG